jgi:hypothetical protein
VCERERNDLIWTGALDIVIMKVKDIIKSGNKY